MTDEEGLFFRKWNSLLDHYKHDTFLDTCVFAGKGRKYYIAGNCEFVILVRHSVNKWIRLSTVRIHAVISCTILEAQTQINNPIRLRLSLYGIRNSQQLSQLAVKTPKTTEPTDCQNTKNNNYWLPLNTRAIERLSSTAAKHRDST